MLLYETTEKEGRLDVETKVFYEEGSYKIFVNQYLFKGGDVLSCSQVDLNIEQISKICQVATLLYSKLKKDDG